jgi:hypothetical protein
MTLALCPFSWCLPRWPGRQVVVGIEPGILSPSPEASIGAGELDGGL